MLEIEMNDTDLEVDSLGGKFIESNYVNRLGVNDAQLGTVNGA